MKKYGFLVVLAMLVFAACNQKATTQESTTSTEVNGQHFGAKITPDDAMAFDDLMSKMAMADSLNVKVKGKVEEVCQMKGCWMNIVSDKNEDGMFVKFKDYGFFVPKDIAGQEVIMEGVAYREVVSVDELRHYAEDAGKSAEEIAAIKAPEEEFRFMAAGVIVFEQ